jgi:hypothetical protein
MMFLQCGRYDLNVKFLIFFKTIYKVQSIEVLGQDPVNKMNFSSGGLYTSDQKLEWIILLVTALGHK